MGRLKVSDISSEAININVEGRQVVGPLQGFGKLWQKTYWVRLSGAAVTPAELVGVWKENFSRFWPEDNRFYAPFTGISPGDVARSEPQRAGRHGAIDGRNGHLRR